MSERTLTVKILGDSRSLERAFLKGDKSANNFRRRMDSVSRSTGIAAVAIGGTLAVAFRAGFDEASESQKVLAQTGAVLKSTSGAANVTAKSVENLAGSLSRMSGVDDEAIQNSQNLLLTFTKIRNEVGKGNDVFDQATKAALDLSVRFDKDLASSSIMLGKALNDPVRGLTALSRAGVQFTQEQKSMVKALVASGNTLDAQKLILAEVATQTEGAAEAYGKTMPAQFAKARNAYDEAAGSLTESLLPALTVLAQNVAVASNFLGEHKTITKVLVIGLGALAVTLGVVSVATRSYTAATTIARVATRLFTVETKAATVANATLGRTVAATRLSLIGKAGLVGAVGLASFGIASLILKVTGLDEKLKGLGSSAFDAAAKLGLVNDPGAKFEGKRVLTGKEAVALRSRAAKLDTTTALSDTQIRQKLFRENPNVRREEIALFVNRELAKTPIVVQVNLDGQQLEQSTTKRQQKTQRRNPPQRRGPNRGR